MKTIARVREFCHQTMVWFDDVDDTLLFVVVAVAIIAGAIIIAGHMPSPQYWTHGLE